MGIGKKYQSPESRIPIKDAREVYRINEDPKSIARLHNFDARVIESLRTAIDNSTATYRTVGALALETGLPEDQVSQMLRVTPAGRESPLRTHDGQKLYRGTNTHMNRLERAEAIRRILAKDF
jgi:hypothetical protein